MSGNDAPSLRVPGEAGAKPDFYSYRPVTGEISTYTLLDEMIAHQPNDGATFFRATIVNGRQQPCPEGEEPAGFWLEGWIERPDDQGPFDPPLTARET